MDLSDRMKLYEGFEADRRLMPRLPVLARMDGRCFHRFTRDLHRPFDERFVDLITQTTKTLMQETSALLGYTQSDEITLLFYRTDPKSHIFCDGRVAKMTSLLASMTTVFFHQALSTYLPNTVSEWPTFDARVWTVPTPEEAVNVFVWREHDATRNSMSMTAQAHYSPNALHGKNSKDLHEMLHAKGINWNEYPSRLTRGTSIRKTQVARSFTTEEMECLPAHHEARKNPDLVYFRSDIIVLDLPPIGRMSNRINVVFDGADPVVSPED